VACLRLRLRSALYIAGMRHSCAVLLLTLQPTYNNRSKQCTRVPASD